MEKLNPGPVNFGTIKMPDMKTIEKINKIHATRPTKTVGYILVYIAAKTAEAPLRCSYETLAGMLNMSRPAMSKMMGSLRKHGLRITKTGSYEYEFSVEL